MPTPIFGNLIKTSDSVMMYVIQYVLYNLPITRGHIILDTLQKMYYQISTSGPWLLQISESQFTFVRIFKKWPKYPAYAIFTK